MAFQQHNSNFFSFTPVEAYKRSKPEATVQRQSREAESSNVQFNSSKAATADVNNNCQA